MISDVVTEGTQRAGDAELAKGGEMAKEEKINYPEKRKTDRSDVEMPQNDKKSHSVFPVSGTEIFLNCDAISTRTCNVIFGLYFRMCFNSNDIYSVPNAGYYCFINITNWRNYIGRICN